MARYKVNTPNFEDPKSKLSKKLAKKRKQIFYICTCIWGIILIIGILTSGLNRHNGIIVGWTRITMGIINLLFVAFVLYTEIKRWYQFYMHWSNYDIIPKICIDAEEEKNDIQEHYFLMAFLGIVIFIFTMWLFVSGINLLLEIS